MRFISWVPFLFILFLLSCSDDSSESNSVEVISDSQEVKLERSDFVRIPASGKSVKLGTSESGASVRESPEISVRFTYDYYIAKHEVTRGEYFSLLPNIKKKDTASAENIPMTGVTYFDAVLFANAMSVRDSLDTAYTYTTAHFDSMGNCYSLEGFTFNPAVNAYRLPTESEWVYAAQKGWKVDEGWHGGNSGYALHDVCTKKENGFGLCDMAGNAQEWVNDWFSYFTDKSFTNFAGGVNGGNLGERVVKGGHYRSDPDHLNFISRSDVYTVLSSNHYAYLGFRLAFGAIPDPEWGNQLWDAASNIVVQTTATKIRPVTGTFNMRLAFRNDVTENLVFVNFASDGQVATEIQDTMPVYHPVFSPDGNWIAFSTKPEGARGHSDLYVRYMHEDSVYAHRLDVESAAVPRWRVLPDGDTVIVYVTDAGDNSDASVWSGTSTWQVSWKGGAFGKPQKLFDGAYRDGVSVGNSLAISGARQLKARVDGKDTVWFDGEQACNASLSLDGTNRVLFLDFGSAIGKELVGRSYRTHEYILVADSTGTLVQSIAAPKDMAFDHTEWAYNSGLAVATLTNIDGAHTKIVLADVENDRVITLVTGTELWHPSFWMQKPVVAADSHVKLDPDSAGRYYVENGSSAASLLRVKMELFWRYRDSANVVVLGSSRPSTAVDPTEFSDDFFAVNLSCVPNVMDENRFLFENYVLNHMPRVKYLVTSLDIDLWWRTEDDADNFFLYEYKSYPGYVYDENHGFWKDGYPEGMQEYTENGLYVAYDKMVHSKNRGLQWVLRDVGWLENPPVDFDSTWLDMFPDRYKKNLDALKRLLKLAQDFDVKVVGVVFPQSPGYKKTGSFGRYGIRRSEADSLLKELKDLEKVYENFRFMDENKMGDHDYPDSLAHNYDHLMNESAPMMTRRIDSVFRTF